MSKRSAATPEQVLAAHTPEVRVLAERLRQVVRGAVPAATEVAYPGWHAIGYRHPEAGYCCGIFPLGESVRLYFEFGALLPDPEGLLTAGGKQTRYMEFAAESQIPARAIRKFLAAAVRLPPGRSVKLALSQPQHPTRRR